MSTILFCHDNVEYATTRAELWEVEGGHTVILCTSAKDSYQRIKFGELPDVTVAIFHKDIAEYDTKYTIDMLLHELQERDPFIKIGVTSGEFPNGKNTVLAMRADFYFPSIQLPGDDPWLLDQLNHPIESAEELANRGLVVQMPEGTFRVERGSLSDLMRW